MKSHKLKRYTKSHNMKGYTKLYKWNRVNIEITYNERLYEIV